MNAGIGGDERDGQRRPGQHRGDPAGVSFGSTARLNMTVPIAFGMYHSVSASPLVTE